MLSPKFEEESDLKAINDLLSSTKNDNSSYEKLSLEIYDLDKQMSEIS